MKKHFSATMVAIRYILILVTPISIMSHAPKEPVQKQQVWSNWKTTSCYKYLTYRIRKVPSGAEWAIQFNNQYRKSLAFDIEIINGRGHDRLIVASTKTVTQNGYYSDDKTISFKLKNINFGNEETILEPCVNNN